jgi:deoxyribose-phosphate aldolase
VTSADALAALIDHTLLKPEATPEQVRALCDEAVRHGFATVCVNPVYVPLAAEALAGEQPGVCTVVGFPLGATLSAAKAAETRLAIEAGATEIDMVLAVGLLKAGDYEAVERDVRAVVESASGAEGGPVPVKVILETVLLTDEEKAIASAICVRAGARFVKTSTGFGGGGANEHDVALMRRAVGDALGVKASGGIRSRKDAEAMVARGATRLGCSAGVKIVRGGVSSSAY